MLKKCNEFFADNLQKLCKNYDIDYNELSITFKNERSWCDIGDYTIDYENLRFLIDNKIDWFVYAQFFERNKKISKKITFSHFVKKKLHANI